jgi:hypothetical protein
MTTSVPGLESPCTVDPTTPRRMHPCSAMPARARCRAPCSWRRPCLSLPTRSRSSSVATISFKQVVVIASP